MRFSLLKSREMSEVMEISSRSMISGAVSPDLLHSLSYKHPSSTTKIFKEECMWCFNTPLHPGGLLICLNTFAGFCPKHIVEYCERTGQRALLRIQQTKIEQPESEGPQDKVTRLAIDVDGGFQSAPKSGIVTDYFFTIFPTLQSEVTLDKLSGDLREVCAEVVASEGAQRTEQLQMGMNEWDGEAKIVTKHADLPQLDNGVKVPRSGWKCQAEGCELTENLWLNLTDGAIKCGRSQYIQEGVLSKGNNHMRQHYDDTGYPLVVKLGTITKEDADVFSYDEDESVRDPNLAMHLMHFGIDVQTAEKTEKSTLELELDMNQKWEWAMCQEDGANLELAYGPALTGMVNIGSSCYMNSSIQMLLEVPDFRDTFGKNSSEIFSSVDAVSSHDSFNCQTAKVFSCLLNGDYSKKGSNFNAISPRQFRRVVGRGHHEFSTNKQQDAEEFIRYFLSKVDENAGTHASPVDALRFKMESRFMDCASGKVRYELKEEIVLSLMVPLSPSSKSEVSTDGAPLRPTVSLEQCLSATLSEQSIDDFRSPVTGEVTGARVINRIATFPDVLVVHLQKFFVTDHWTVKKMDVNIKVSDVIDLEAFRGHGKRPDEELLPSDDKEASSNAVLPHVDAAIVDTLCSMGFSAAAARRAAYMTSNAGIEQASNWLMEHLNDADINEEHPDFVPKMHTTVKGIAEAASVGELTVLGFTPHQARYALKQTSNNVNAAAEWLFANLDKVPPEETTSVAEATHNFRDGSAKYALVGFISHMGTSPYCGHYVVHLKKGDKWYLFNDEKVAESQNPPSALAYIYLYKRL
uniref:Ubiquitin carboxyl-terminal hydrolase n=1 Tax=Ascaris suum TaxID=6253 RepID=F1KUG9_ASCSU